MGKRVVTKLAKPDEPETIVVSYSELDTFRQCPLKHYLAYEKRWTKPQVPDSPLYKGIFWHDVMEAHYKGIQKARKKGLLESVVESYAERHGMKVIRERSRLATTDEEREVVDLITWMYEGYLAKYRADPQWDILGVETRIEATLGPFPHLVPPGIVAPRFRLKAKLDIVVFDHEAPGVWVVDHKSGANLPSQMDLEIDDQFGLYQVLLGKKGHKALGSIHSATRTTRNAGDRPENQDEHGEPIKKSHSKQTPEQRMHRTYLNRGAAELQSIELDAWAAAMNAHATPLPVYSAPDPRSCGWKCDFKEQHLIMRSGRPESEVMPEYGFVQDFTRH